MNVLFNSKKWLPVLGVAVAVLGTDTTIMAQNSNTPKEEDKTIIINESTTEKSKYIVRDRCGDVISYQWKEQMTEPESTEKPKLGVFLAEEKEGAVISSVIPASAAAQAGLQEGDKILKINENATSTIKSLQDAVAAQKVGDQVVVVYERNGQTMSANVVLQKSTDRYKIERRHFHQYKASPEEISKNACERLDEINGRPFLGVYHLDASGNGVRLTSIIPKTGAEKAELKAEDVIVKIDNKEIADSDALVAYVRSKKPGDKVRIQIIREGQKKTIPATIGSWANNPQNEKIVAALEKECGKNAPEEPINENPNARQEVDKVNTLENNLVMEVYPNPTADVVNVKFEGKKAPLQISIVSIDGKVMMNQNINNFNGVYMDQLDFSKFNPGIYVIHFQQGDEKTTQQVVVE